MPIFFQHQINDTTRLGIWKIEESEEFFKGNVPQHRDVTHPHKRLQHLAGRFLLQFLFPDFPYALIRIADTRKPFLPNELFHFSISHCGDYAAAIVSKDRRVGIDVEIPTPKIERIKAKFLKEEEFKIFSIGVLSDTIHPDSYRDSMLNPQRSTLNPQLLTLLWSCKESVFKWYGNGNVDFREHIRLHELHEGTETIDCFFSKASQPLTIHYRRFDHLVLAWVMS